MLRQFCTRSTVVAVILVVALATASAVDAPSAAINSAQRTVYAHALGHASSNLRTIEEKLAFVTASKALQLTIAQKPSLCSDASVVASNPQVNVRDLADAVSLSTLLDCPVQLTDAAKKTLTLGVQSDRIEDAASAVRTVFAIKSLSAHDFDISDAAALASDLLLPDGNARIAAAATRSSLRFAGLAYELLGTVFARASDLEDALKTRIRNASKLLSVSLKAAAKPGIAVVDIAVLLRGIATFQSAVEEKVAIESADVSQAAAAISRSRHVRSPIDVAAVLSAATYLSSNPISVPLVVTVAESVLGADDGFVTVTVTDMLGNALPSTVTPTVTATSISNAADKKVIDASTIAATTKGVVTSAALASASAGTYVITLNVNVNNKNNNNKNNNNKVVDQVYTSLQGLERRVRKSGEISSVTGAVWASKRDTGAAPDNAAKGSSPTPLFKSSSGSGSLSIDANDFKYLRVVVKAATGKGAGVPVGVLRLQPWDTLRSFVAIPLTVDSSSSSSSSNLVAAVSLSGADIRRALGEDTGKPRGFNAFIDISASNVYTPSSWPLGGISVSNYGNAPEARVEPAALPRELQHTFGSGERRPFAIVSLISAVAVASPLALVLLYLVVKRGVKPNFGDAAEAIVAIPFMAALAGMVGLNLVYWFFLNIFQAFMVNAMGAIVLFVLGHRALKAIHARKGLELEPSLEEKELSGDHIKKTN